MFHLIIFILIHVDASSVYKSIDSCVFNHTTVDENSNIKCGSKCNINQCKAFLFDKNTKNCISYKFSEICQSNTACTNKTIFISDRYNNLYESDNNGFRFKILNGINYKFDSGTPSVFNIIDSNKASPLIVGKSNKVIMALGTYGSSKLIVYPKATLFVNFHQSTLSKNRFLINSLKYFTNGVCVRNLDCLRIIDDYKIYIGFTNQVFLINTVGVFNLTELINQINNYNWHFIVTGTFWTNVPSYEVKQLVNLYGICITKSSDYSDFMINGNICQRITNYA